MKKERYMSKNEMLDAMKVGTFSGELEAIANRTPESEWRKRLRSAATNCQKVLEERLFCLDKDQLQTVQRRHNHNKMVYVTSDDKRYVPTDKENPQELVTVSIDDLYTVIDHAFESCHLCEQGSKVKDCQYRKLYHRLGVPVARDNPKTTQCEFMWEDKRSDEDGGNKTD